MRSYQIVRPGAGLDAWEIAERPEPQPKAGEVLIRVKAAALNYRDWLIARGTYLSAPKENAIPLSDGAGVVTAVGDGVTRWKVGDRVCCTFFQTWQHGPMPADAMAYSLGGTVDGVLSEYIAVPQTALVRIPDYLSFEEASTLPCAALTAWNALMVSGPRLDPGSSVLVMGTGGVSLFAAQLGLAAGWRVIATSSSDEKIARLRALGVQDAINYKKVPAWEEEVRYLTSGLGVDHVIEVGGGGTLEKSLRAVRQQGTVSLIGVLTGFADVINPAQILATAARVNGILVGSTEMLEALVASMDRTRIKPVIDDLIPFDDARHALEKMVSGAHFGKIVIAFG